MSEKFPEDLIGIEETALLLRRSQQTIRIWSSRGRTPSGEKLTTYRDDITNNRYFSRAEVIRIRGSIFRMVPA